MSIWMRERTGGMTMMKTQRCPSASRNSRVKSCVSRVITCDFNMGLYLLVGNSHALIELLMPIPRCLLTMTIVRRVRRLTELIVCRLRGECGEARMILSAEEVTSIVPKLLYSKSVSKSRTMSKKHCLWATCWCSGRRGRKGPVRSLQAG